MGRKPGTTKTNKGSRGRARVAFYPWIAWADMVKVVRSAKPSRWDPGDRWVPVIWFVKLERHIDMDNLQKAVNDVLEMATGVNDKWFYPIFAQPLTGASRKEAGIALLIDPPPDDLHRWIEKALIDAGVARTARR